MNPSAELTQTLERYNQRHLLRWWDELDEAAQRSLVEQIERIDFPLIERLLDEHRRAASDESEGSTARALRARPPAEMIRLPQSDADRQRWDEADRRGREMLAAGEVGVILVAGGQGTRLRFPHAKGMFPVGPVSGATLYQILAEQLRARTEQAAAAIPYYVMTSDATHDETVAFFAAHNSFGLDPGDVRFFRQGNMPAASDVDGRLLLAEKGLPATSPDGHGGILAALSRDDLFDDMLKRGVRTLYYHQVDNPTAIVCDPAFLGFHRIHDSQASTKVAAKRSWREPMGMVVEVDGGTQIIEYSDAPDEVKQQTDDSGGLLLWAGNTAIHAFEREFLERLVGDERSLPIHVAHKTVDHIDESGKRITPEKPNAYKFERFIFDALPRAETALVVECDRAREFNPVKNAEGDDSPATSQAAMTALHREWLKAAGATVASDAVIEISPLFALSAADVAARVDAECQLVGEVYLEGGG